jgi:hypothetical protein
VEDIITDTRKKDHDLIGKKKLTINKITEVEDHKKLNEGKERGRKT